MTTAIETAANLIASNTVHVATASIKSSAEFFARAAKDRPQYAGSAAVYQRALEIRNSDYPGNH